MCVQMPVREREKQMESFTPYIWSVVSAWTLGQISMRFL